MKWFFKWLQRRLDSAEVEEEKKSDVNWATQSNLVARRPRGSMATMKIKSAGEEGLIHLSQSPMNFRLYPATGGHIVEYSYYDEKTDRNTQALHLIASDRDLGDAISKIMTLEALRR